MAGVYAKLSLEDSNLTDETRAQIGRIARVGWSIHVALVLLPFAGRGARGWIYRRHRPPMLTHSGGRTIPILPGASEAIVGAMGPPRSQIITTIGDTVNTCARLESLTKEYDCPVIVSRQAAEMAGLDLTGRQLYQAPVKGRVGTVELYCLKSLADLRV